MDLPNNDYFHKLVTKNFSRLVIFSLLLSLFLYFPSFALSSDWSTSFHDLRNTSFAGAPPVNFSNFGQAWTINTNMIVGGIIQCDNFVIVSGTDFSNQHNRVRAFRTNNGNQVWEFILDESTGAMDNTPTCYAGKIFFGGQNDSNLYALDLTTGDLLWKFSMGASSTMYDAHPKAYAGKIFFQGFDRFYCVDVDTGTPVWDKQIEGHGRATPAIHNDVVYTLSSNGTLYALNYTTGEEIWRIENATKSGIIQDAIVLAEQKLFLRASEQTIKSFSLQGDLLWEYSGPSSWNIGEGIGPLAYSGGKIFLSVWDNGNERSVLKALKAGSGDELWSFTTSNKGANTPLILNDNTVLIQTWVGGNIFALDSENGNEIWQYSGLGTSYAQPIFAHNALFTTFTGWASGAEQKVTNDGKVSYVESSTGHTTITKFAEGVEEPVSFPDKNLKNAIRNAIDKPSGDIYPSDLEGLTELHARGQNISELGGLEYCVSLRELSLSENRINDLSVLSELTNLTHLWLHSNNISNISPLADLINLTELGLSNTDIKNNIEDTMSVLSNLPNLSVLGLSNIDLGEDITMLPDFTNLRKLYLNRNEITDINTLSSLNQLTLLALNHNNIEEIGPLSGLTNLETLFLTGNKITSVDALSNLNKLYQLNINKNKLHNITALSELTNIHYLFLQENNIDDISPLVNNPGLGTDDDVTIRYNDLDLSEGSEDLKNIQILLDRGVDIGYQPQEKLIGFETFQDQSTDAGKLTPGSTFTTQVIKVADQDYNSDILKINKIKIENLGTAKPSDINEIKVEALSQFGVQKTHNFSPVNEFPLIWNPKDVFFGDQIKGVESRAKVKIQVKLSDDPDNGRTIKTKLTVEGTEGGTSFSQSATDGAAETIKSEGETPVIFIPGIMGSYLHEYQTKPRSELVWDPDSSFNSLWEAITDLPLRNPKRPLLAYDIAHEAYKEKLAQISKDLGYCKDDPFIIGYPFDAFTNPEHGAIFKDQPWDWTEGNIFFYFPYDFRQSISNIADNLAQAVGWIKSKTNSSKLNIISHSMGGMVARYYANHENSNDIDKLVLLGAPNHGTAKAYSALKFGCMHAYKNSNNKCSYALREFANNFPASYEQLPTYGYFQKFDYFITDQSGNNLDGGGDPSLAWKETFVNNSDSKIEFENKERKNEAINFNQTLLDDLNTSADVFAFADRGTPTVRRITSLPIKVSGSITEPWGKWKPEWACGDGEITTEVALGIDNTGQGSINKYVTKNINHGDLLKELASPILKRIFLENQGDITSLSWIEEWDGSCVLDSQNTFWASANVTFRTKDNSGNSNKFPGGSPRIPSGYNYMNWQGNSYLATPKDRTKLTIERSDIKLPNEENSKPQEKTNQVKTTLANNSQKDLDISVITYENEDIENSYLFKNVQFTEDTKGHMNYDPEASEPPVLELDKDGDGTVDAKIRPTDTGPLDNGAEDNYIIHGPNPVPSEGCIFWLDLPTDTQSALLKIYDVDGRPLFEANIDPGQSRYPTIGRWEPRDANGHKLGSGPYMYRLKVEHSDGSITWSEIHTLVVDRSQ